MIIRKRCKFPRPVSVTGITIQFVTYRSREKDYVPWYKFSWSPDAQHAQDPNRSQDARRNLRVRGFNLYSLLCRKSTNPASSSRARQQRQSTYHHFSVHASVDVRVYLGPECVATSVANIGFLTTFIIAFPYLLSSEGGLTSVPSSFSLARQ